MKVIIERDTFLSLLKTLLLSADVTGKSSKIIHQYVHVRGTNKKVIFSTTNGTVGTMITADSDTELPGECVFLGKRMLELVKQMRKSKNIVLTILEDKRLRVSQGKSRVHMNTLEPSDFPIIPFFPKEQYTEICPKALLSAIRKVSYCASSEDTRIAMMGIHLDTTDEEGFIRVVCTDGHRIASIRIPGVLRGSFTIHGEAIKILTKSLETTEELGIVEGESQVNFCLDKGVINCNIVAARFPPYKTVFPSGKPIPLTLNVSSMLEACKRSMIFAGGRLRVTLTAAAKTLTLNTKDNISDFTETVALLNEEELPEEVTIHVCVKYLIQAMEHLDEPTFTLQIYGERLPMVISEKSLSKAIMPVIG